MGGAPQVAMRVTSQIWQIIFASQTLQVFCFCFANPLGFSFGPSQKGTICSSVGYALCIYTNTNHIIHTLSTSPLVHQLEGLFQAIY
jgi:hypothetical protein